MSKHNPSIYWARHSFDSVPCFDIRCNLGDVLVKLRDIRTAGVSASIRQIRSKRFVPRRVTLCCVLHASSLPWSILVHSVGSIFYGSQIVRCGVQWKGQTPRLFLPLRALPTSLRITCEIFAHNMWNPMLELLFHVQIGGIFEIFVEEINSARVALSCHFALDLLRDKAGTHDSA